ncbi:polysaccharide biosynthesis tyrosine autokinase [Frondihabitans sp. VKM Ac-2883]|jgi:capsular exopolysaccharide synthesis family protein|uniref:polysaccharide biosynthesis tyrosine autokinase n=1 Tax=Frondihabitans sp. VKM Ac-2883 TaxID=2783823 RepID=UPI00188A8D27|nr:polysaccharide biosynthesis tyrosine autokinase [Frondihabitans sp. VKM Ac-2883]MBF4575741.1 polysaccharide biosynthesis tyrosine autokinase [Frondihabitans sp. VKM Ac-2883]
MTLNDYARVLRQGWLTVLAFLVVAISGAFALTAVTPERYAATAELYVSIQASTSTTAGEIGQGSTAAQQKVRSYTEVATTSRVLQPVIDSLDLETTPGQLAKQITVTSSVNTVVVSLTATNEDPAQAARIANAVGESLRDVVDSLESPAGGGDSLVRLESVQPATSPTTPVSPRLTTNILIGCLAGLLAGFAAVIFRNTFDTRIRGEHDLPRGISTPLIGTIGFDPTASKRPLIVHLDPRSPRAESFRSLRTNLQFLDAERPARIFALTSAMPSEGKTTTVANLAISLAESGARVVVIDADLRRPRLAEVMGLEGAVGLTDVLIGRAEIDDVSQPWGTRSLMVIPAGQIPPNPSELLGSRAMQALLETLGGLYDYVLLDTPPLLPVTDAAVLSKLTDGVVLVAAAGRSRRPQFDKALCGLDAIDARVLGVVLTMLPLRGPNKYGQNVYGGYYGPPRDEPMADHRAFTPKGF